MPLPPEPAPKHIHPKLEDPRAQVRQFQQRARQQWRMIKQQLPGNLPKYDLFPNMVNAAKAEARALQKVREACRDFQKAKDLYWNAQRAACAYRDQIETWSETNRDPILLNNLKQITRVHGMVYGKYFAMSEALDKSLKILGIDTANREKGYRFVV